MSDLLHLRRVASLVRQFSLDALMLQTHATNEGPALFGFVAGEITLESIYYLSVYARANKISTVSPEKLLHYLRLVNDPLLKSPEHELSNDQIRLVRDEAAVKLGEILGWSSRDVLDIAKDTRNAYSIVSSLVELDHVLYVYELSKKTRLDARTLLQLGALSLTSSDSQYHNASQLAMACLSGSQQATVNMLIPEVGQSVLSNCVVSQSLLIARKTDPLNKAIYTLSVRDLDGNPLTGIAVRWKVEDAGILDQKATWTDEQGETVVTLKPGEIMGIARLRATIGLEQQIAAPTVLIDCEESSLELILEVYPVIATNPLSGEKETVVYRVGIEDRFGNRGIDRLVTWQTSHGRLLETEVSSNREGVAMARLVCKNAGKAEVSATYGKADPVIYPAVTFVDRPYIDKTLYGMQSRSCLLLDEDITVSCRMLTLAGDGAPDQTIEWLIDGAHNDLDTSITDKDGIATFMFKAWKKGPVTLRARFTPPGEKQHDVMDRTFDILTSPVLSAGSATRHEAIRQPDGVLYLRANVQARKGEVSAQADAGELLPLSNYPLEWQAAALPGSNVVLTNAAGVSTCAFPLTKAGKHTVTVPWAPDKDDALTFDVTVREQPKWIFTVDSQPVKPGVPFNLTQGQNYTFGVIPENSAEQDWLIGQDVSLSWAGPNAQAYGVVPEPFFGQVASMSKDGLSWTVKCTGSQEA